MSDENRCAGCGAELAADAPQGLCPGCLLKRGLQSQTGPTGASQPGDADYRPPTPAELASYFPDLEILELIGRGGMGVVYKARQKRLDRLVALKILSPKIGQDPAFAERFAREARAMAMLSHPHIVAVYDFGQTEMRGEGTEACPLPSPLSPLSSRPLYYFLMEFVDGVNLRRLLDTGKLAPEEALAIVPQICDALQYAHDHGVVHRDIKPENVLLNKEGRVKIADFGIAKLMRPSESSRHTPCAVSHGIRRVPATNLTGVGQVMGTPQYMAPEQIEHPLDVDHRADIYSLGVVFYQMLTGELPIGRFAPPSKKVQIDVRLDEVVLRALEKEPDRRYQQASEIKTRVETIVTTPPGPLSGATGGASGTPAGKSSGPASSELNDRVRQFLNSKRWLLTPVVTRHGKRVINWPAAIFTSLAIFGAIIFPFALWSGLLELLGRNSGADQRQFIVLELIVLPLVAIAMTLYIRWKLKLPIEKLPAVDSPASRENVRGSGIDGTADDAIEQARRQVQGPAIGLLVTGILNWVTLTVAAIVIGGRMYLQSHGTPSVTMLIVVFSAFACGIVMILAALKMKRLQAYGLAIAGSTLAIICSPGNLIGLPIGIWALVVLSQREVRDAFSQRSRGKSGRRPPQTENKGVKGAPATDGSREWPTTGWDWLTWRPCQSAEVREIYAHLTDAEKAKLIWLGLLFGVVIFVLMGSVPILSASFAKFGLVIDGVILLIAVILAPFSQRWQRRFLCSTAWARQQGITPDRLRLFDFSGGKSGATAATRSQHVLGIVALVLAMGGTPLALMGQLTWSISPLFSVIAMVVPLIFGIIAWRSPAGKAAVIFSTIILVTTGPILIGSAVMFRDIGSRQGMVPLPPPIAEANPVRRQPSQSPFEGPLQMSPLPAGWKLEYRGKSGPDFYSLSTQIDGSGLLMFSTWPPGGTPEDIPGNVRKLADGFLEISQKQHAYTFAAEKYKIESFTGQHCKGSYVTFHIGSPDTNLVSAMFMMSVDGQIWSGQFSGEAKHWVQALEMLKAIRKKTGHAPRNIPPSKSASQTGTGEARPVERQLSSNIQPFDVLEIRAIGTLVNQPIDNYYLVELDGSVALGPAYGRANVKGLTMEQAEAKITKQLKKTLTKPEVQVSLARRMATPPEAAAELSNIQPLNLLEIRVIGTLVGQPVDGYYVVEPDGRVALGPAYGRANVKGLTMEQAEAKITKQLKKTVAKPDVQVRLARLTTKRQEAVFPKLPYVISSNDVLKVCVMGTFSNRPIDGDFRVEPAGTIPLGPAYGRVQVSGLTLEAAEKAIRKKLEPVLQVPQVQVTLSSNREDSPAVHWQEAATPKAPYTIKPGDLLLIDAIGTIVNQPIHDTCLVEPAGSVALGPAYGRAKVEGLTLEAAERAIKKKLQEVLANPAVSVTLAGWEMPWKATTSATPK